MSVTKSNAVLGRLTVLLGEKTPWRDIAALEPFCGIPVRTLWKMNKDQKIPDKWRAHLGLPPLVSVESINGSEIPEGSQVHHADTCVRCNRPYISNHPRRRRCFICSPYRGN